MLLLMTGCSENDKEESEKTDAIETIDETKETDMFTERDCKIEYDESTSVKIKLEGDSVSCNSDAVEISGTTVTILDEGTFIFSGTLNDGMIIVNADEKDKPQIVLDGVSITSETCAPLYILEADKVFVTLAEGSENTLTNGGSFIAVDDNNIDGTVFSKQDVTFNGLGSLTVMSPADHGIVCKDDLVFTSGSYVINSASHGLDANDSVRITKASLTIDAGKDGIHVENTEDTAKGFLYIKDGALKMEAEGDGMSAGAYLQIKDGSFHIVSGGGSVNASKQTSDAWGGFKGGGMGGRRPEESREPYQSESISSTTETEDSSTSIKAIKAAGDLTIDGGSFDIDSADDSVHSNASISINGGTFQIASGDDGFHADDTLSITAGTIQITESYEGLEGLHIKVSGGDIKLVSSDDGLNAAGGTDSSGMGGMRGGDQFGGRGGGMSSPSNGSIAISGGSLYVNASGDGIDANGYLEITGGYTVVVGPTQGDTATLDYDTTATISGGTFIGTGAMGMAQTFSDSNQGVIAVSVGECQAETEIVLKDSSGNMVISYAPELSFGVVILSSPEIVKGDSYTIMVGEASGTFEAY